MEPSDFKPLPSVGPGVHELRIRVQGAFRAFYVAKFDEAVYVLLSFRRSRSGPRRSTSTSARLAIAPYSLSGARAQEANMAIKMTRGSGNVFADLGFPAAEAANLQLRSTLMIQLRKRLTARGATQAQAARLLDVSQPRISDLYRGKIERFSVDTLIAMLDKTGADVRVSVRSRTTAA